MLPPSAVKAFYDRFGARQDKQAFYEDRALDDLVTHAALPSARHIVEFGCGTGRFAYRMLTEAPQARYTGCDVSTTMVALAEHRLSTFKDRVSVRTQPEGSVLLPAGPQSADRLVSTYVLDLLPAAQIHTFFGEARRVLAPGGRLCLVGISPGFTVRSRVLMAGWAALWRVAPGIVGGCRPISVAAFVRGADWSTEHVGRVDSWGVASEVVVAALPN
jgi:ubiquinone/menaquinone biosynthesis C-methylase UbiE